MRQELVGYILGALDEDEQQRLDQSLSRDAALKDDWELLKRGLDPLEENVAAEDPPPDLAKRTCEFVAAYRGPGIAAASRAYATPMLFEQSTSKPVRRWSFADVAVAAGILIAATLLLIPAVGHSQFNARVLACQDNLREIGAALYKYAEFDPDGRIPSIPQSGELSLAGAYAPKLLQAGLILDPRRFICAGSSSAGNPPVIPVWDELVKASRLGKDSVAKRYPNLGGSFAYNLGYYEDNIYRTVSLNDAPRTNFVLMADEPCHRSDWTRSRNHDGNGQNVLYHDGRVTYISGCRSPGCTDSNFYLNDDGEVAAGRHENDSVVGGRLARPCR